MREPMKTIKSFQVDHTKLQKGLYLSRVDGDCVTYDIRMCTPNGGIYLQNAGLHTFEPVSYTHLGKVGRPAAPTHRLKGRCKPLHPPNKQRRADFLQQRTCPPLLSFPFTGRGIAHAPSTPRPPMGRRPTSR